MLLELNAQSRSRHLHQSRDSVLSSHHVVGCSIHDIDVGSNQCRYEFHATVVDHFLLRDTPQLAEQYAYCNDELRSCKFQDCAAFCRKRVQ